MLEEVRIVFENVYLKYINTIYIIQQKILDIYTTVCDHW